MMQVMHDNDDHESIYYGQLTDIISLNYGGSGRIVLFRCDWVNTTTDFKIDPFGFSMLNFSCLIHTGEREEHEPFILTTQGQMVYYVRDPKKEDALHPDHVLVVEFNERGQPYGDLQPTLANFIGTIARNGLVLPLHFLDWRKMLTNRLNDAWKLVTAHFYIPNHHRRVIMQIMGVAWRWWRTEVKATSYDSNTPLEELVAIQPIPHGLTPQTWKVLCNYWKSTENLLKEVVDRLLQDKPEGTQPLEVHEEAFRFIALVEDRGSTAAVIVLAIISSNILAVRSEVRFIALVEDRGSTAAVIVLAIISSNILAVRSEVRYASISVNNRFYRYHFYRYPSVSVLNRFYRYPSESALSHEPQVSFTVSFGFSVANIRNDFEPVQ
ncbi:hypothetical protein ZIOFF_003468 [Zingiber officinale]|uniref:DUF4216 domain-containing protein n=1 Tax=Zingiber officinale TaxID=94328 RepID=A0A8J5LWP6_ZINOF|nr:hypothetical protein ZIOFF_003468 [Zingiber officinale]